MDVALGLVVFVTGVLLVTAASRRIGLASPLALIVVGIAVSYLPFVPEVELRPDVVLLGLVPPLLYAASLDTSVADLNRNRRAILLLSVGLVALTAAGTALVVHRLVPDLPWWAAFALGAVVAPPDAVAATAVGRRIGLPRRIVTILEGESLLNDAAALVALRTATAATAAAGTVVRDVAVAAGGGVVVGLLVYVVVAQVRRRLTDPLVDSGLSLVVPFAAYVGAESLGRGGAHGSGVLAVVVAGLLLGHRAPVLQTARARIQERANWKAIAFLLENAVFVLIGLQAARIVRGALAEDPTAHRVVVVCAAVLLTLTVLRLAWMFLARYVLVRPYLDATTRERPSPAYTIVLGWAGMRGVVTLAGALALPLGTPHRDLLLLVAFAVVVGSLLVQGTTLPLLARRLRLPPPDPAADARARAELSRRAAAAATAALGPVEVHARHEMIRAERRFVLAVRDDGTVPHEVVTEVLAMLDLEESMLGQEDQSGSPGPTLGTSPRYAATRFR